MWLRTGCDITFDVSVETPFTLMLRPHSDLQQWIARESYTLKPSSIHAVEYTDNYGNLCERLIAPAGEFAIRTSADILTADEIDVAPATEQGHASTHAWVEVYLPGTGWKGFDPTAGEVTSSKDIANAVARNPEAVPPVAGSFLGSPSNKTTMHVDVKVSLLA